MGKWRTRCLMSNRSLWRFCSHIRISLLLHSRTLHVPGDLVSALGTASFRLGYSLLSNWMEEIRQVGLRLIRGKSPRQCVESDLALSPWLSQTVRKILSYLLPRQLSVSQVNSRAFNAYQRITAEVYSDDTSASILQRDGYVDAFCSDFWRHSSI